VKRKTHIRKCASFESKTPEGIADSLVRERRIADSLVREERIADSLVRERRRRKLEERTTEGCLAASGDMIPVTLAPAKVTSQLLRREVLFKFDDGWALGVITRVGLRKNLWNTEITYPRYPPNDRRRDHFLDVGKYSAEEDAESGSWVLIR
jgi:hypothetical protein